MTPALQSTDRGVQEIGPLRAAVETSDFPESLGDFVRRYANLHGDKILGNWFDLGQSLSYRQVDEAADRLADSLVGLGIRKGTHVGVMLPNVPAFPITWIALGRIGAVMIPVNAAYTAEEIRFVLTDSDSQFLVVDKDFLPRFEEVEPQIALIEGARVIVHGGEVEGRSSWQALHDAGKPGFVAPSAVGRNDLLNIQYTSGTTGFPKGCMLTHDYWILISHYAAHFRTATAPIHNILIWAPFFYMDPMWQFLMALRLGATAHVAKRISLSNFYDWLERYEINYCIFPEPALKVREPGPQDARLKLSYAGIYGWNLESRLEIERRFNVIAREGYGMTEIGGGLIVPNGAVEKAQVLTCGLPGPFREMRIVDEDGNDVKQGERGELWVAGRSILWGYYKRPEANRDSFRGKWFRTGDVFMQDADGYYYIVGRIKDMIRRSGENIAAREVEAALLALPQVQEAAAVPVPDPLRREEVKIYLMLKDGVTPQDLPPETVIAHCQSRLAAFKVPRFVAYVDDFPRTPSSKIQKNRILPEGTDPRANSWDRETGAWT